MVKSKLGIVFVYIILGSKVIACAFLFSFDLVNVDVSFDQSRTEIIPIANSSNYSNSMTKEVIILHLTSMSLINV